MHQVVGQLVPHFAIVLGTATQKDGTEPQVGKPPNDLIHPTGNATGYERERPLK